MAVRGHSSSAPPITCSYLLCGIGDEKIQEKEKVMGEIHQRANKPNIQSTSGTNRNECSNAGGSRAEHTEREENNIQGM